MGASTIRVLIVDDYEPWLHRICSMLMQETQFQVVGEASDGLEAVGMAQELQPDLILLDIGLPKLNGIEAARQIRKLAPNSKILFISENRSWDIAEEALRSGGSGYIVKSDVRTQLLAAIRTILQGKQFISTRFIGHTLVDDSDAQIQHSSLRERKPIVPATEDRINRHEVAFYADDSSLIVGFARFIEISLKAHARVIALLKEGHRAAIFQTLQTHGTDPYAAIDEGTLAIVDVADALTKIMVNEQPDRTRCSYFVAELVKRLSKNANGEVQRVVACGECAPTLLAGGKIEAAIQLEECWDEASGLYNVDTLCGYCLSYSHMKSDPIFERVCAQHSAIHTDYPLS